VSTWTKTWGSSYKIAMYGRDYGNSHPEDTRDNFLLNLQEAYCEFGGPICVMKGGFINDRIADLSDSTLPILDLDGDNFRPGIIADGVFLPAEHRAKAIGICNADCPVACFQVYNNGSCNFAGLAMLHAGLNNLAPPQGPSILETFGHWLQENHKHLRWMPYLSPGIQSCCYGCDQNTIERVLKYYRHYAGYLMCPEFMYQPLSIEQVLLGRAKRGPRTGQPSLHLSNMLFLAVKRLLGNKILVVDHTDSASTCSACATNKSDQRLFWSNVYAQTDPDPQLRRARNLTVIGHW